MDDRLRDQLSALGQRLAMAEWEHREATRELRVMVRERRHLAVGDLTEATGVSADVITAMLKD